MDLVISLASVPPADRRKRLEAAADAIVNALRERYPAGEGYVHVKEEGLASAFRRGIRVTRGATWGLSMDLQTVDRGMGELKLTAMAESAVAIYLAVGGFIAGVVVVLGYLFATGHDDARTLKIVMPGGFALGGVLGVLGWLFSRFFEATRPAQVREILDAMAERARRALAG